MHRQNTSALAPADGNAERRAWTARFLVLLSLLGAGASGLGAQASPFLPLDDPRVPLLEYLFLRGDVRDPSPMVRPVRTEDLRAALSERKADRPPAPAALVDQLIKSLAQPDPEAWWRVTPRVGSDATTHGSRDPLHPVGKGGVYPYADARFEARFGPAFLVARPSYEPRLRDDSAYSIREPENRFGYRWRFVEAYASIQTRWVQIHYGQQARNWGPPGLPGLSLSDWSYPRTELLAVIGNGRLRGTAFSTQLTDDSTDTGEPIHRYWVGHRLDLGLARSFQIGLWETAIVAGRSYELEPGYRNPLLLLVFPQYFGRRQRQNVLIGTDLTWRPVSRLQLEAQLALDDWTTHPDVVVYPNRWGVTLGAGGPLAGKGSWRLRYTTVTVTAYRTFNPSENFTDDGVGLARGWPDNELYSLQSGWLVLPQLLVTPEVAFQRQGAARLTDPFPSESVAAVLPTRLSGVVERTLRFGVDVATAAGRLGLVGQAGVQHSDNDGNVAGRSATRFTARLAVRIGASFWGRLEP